MLFESMRRDQVEYSAQTYATMLILYTRCQCVCVCVGGGGGVH